MHINLPEHSIAGVNESMRCFRRNDDDAACFHFALFISDRDGGAAFKRECDFHVGMRMQRRPLPGPGLDDVGRKGRALNFADELMRHSNKRQLIEIDEAHAGNLRETLRSSGANFERTT
jgi:hypothetical protein